jgi:cytochrome P450
MSDAYAVLTDDERYRVPAVVPADAGIGWLRASVARFSDGPTHRRRRAYAVAMLDSLDPAGLARDAAAETASALDRLEAAGAGREPVDLMSAVARPVPVAVLGRALGVHDDDLTARVAAAARAYQPDANRRSVAEGGDGDGGRDADVRADAAVDGLAAGDRSEESAARIGLLVQACEATAALVRNGLRAGSVEAALRGTAPVPRTRRVRDGEVVPVDLRGYPFGAGPHACPGQAHAVAIASAMVDLLWPRAFFFCY